VAGTAINDLRALSSEVLLEGSDFAGHRGLRRTNRHGSRRG
jgi:hypothetical protein